MLDGVGNDQSLAGGNAAAVGKVRWGICALLFFATEINYIDRQVIALLKETLSEQFRWSETDYANIVFAFQLMYAIGLSVAGRFVDRVGVKRGYFWAVLLWSVAAAGHGIGALIGPQTVVHVGSVVLDMTALSVMTFAVLRGALGLAEAGNFPAAIHATGEWFPRRERALATGIFNAGANIGPLTAPYLVPLVTVTLGWAWAFAITGAIGAVWLVLWVFFYDSPERHRGLGEAERAYIRSDTMRETAAKVRWMALLGHRQTWAFAIGKFLTDPFWWFYLFWVPGFLEKNHHVKITEMFWPLLAIYGLSSVGSVAGGYVSSALIRHGRSVNFSRKTALVACAICVTPIFMAARVEGLWPAVMLIALAAAAHQGFSANLFTLVSDTVPKGAISSVVGIGGTAGAIGGMLLTKVVGYVLDVTNHNYVIPFALPAGAYLVAVLVIHWMLPRLEAMGDGGHRQTRTGTAR